MAASMVCRRSLQKFRSFCVTRKHVRRYTDRRNSTSGAYFVFIPEVPADTRETNPIMRHEEYPQFSQLQPNNIVSGCAKLSQEFDSKFDTFLEEVANNDRERSFEEVFNFLEEILAPLQYAEHQAAILTMSNLAKYPKSLLERVTSQIDRSKNDRFVSKDFYNLLKRLDEKRAKLTEPQRRLLDMYLLECRLTGIEVEGKKTERELLKAFKRIYDKEFEFQNKTVFHKSLFHLDLGPGQWDIVKQLPRHVRLSIAMDKSQPDKGPWRVSLLGYVYESFMEVCARRDYRFKVWNAYHTVGTHLTTDIRLHTFEIVDDIRQARWDVATYLGYENYAHMSMETKMAGNVNTVLTMLDTYRNHFLPIAKQEMTELQTYAGKLGFREDLKQWDIPYYRRLHCENKFKSLKIDTQGYFSFDKVLNTLFGLCEKLFHVKFEKVAPETVDTWHPDVAVFDVHDVSGAYISRLYMDPYARRETKMRTNSAEVGRERSDLMGMTPMSFLMLSINKITFPGVPTLLSYKEVLTLFYQFGNSLQQMLTTAPYSELSGQRNIEWDALHVSSYLMKMFAHLPHVIKDMSQHYQTGEQLTDDEINRLLQSQNHMKGFDMCHELYKCAFDIECHLGHEKYWKDVQKDVYNLFMPLELHKEDWIWCSDPTLWLGRTHAAAYYQNIWSEMLAANIFEQFEEGGLQNEKHITKVGRRFRDTYLSLGGGVEAKLVFRQFMGRDPSFNSLIKRYSHRTEQVKE